MSLCYVEHRQKFMELVVYTISMADIIEQAVEEGIADVW